MDYISELPDSILHNILYYLPVKDAARTCVLSKAWNRIQSRTPFLHLYDFDFPSYWSMFSYAEKRLDHHFSNNIAPIISFHLRFFDPSFGYEYANSNKYGLASMLKRVMNQGRIQILDLDLWYYRYNMGLYILPSFVLQSDTLTELILHHCKCDSRAVVRLPKLTTIDLTECDVDDHFIERLIHGCHSLKHLKIHRCNPLTTLRVTCLEKLETVNIKEGPDLQIVEIMSPNLHCIRCYSTSNAWKTNYKRCDLIFSPSKKLVLDETTIENSWLQQQLSTCVELRLQNINCIDDIHISSQNLRKLKINYIRGKSMARINCPNLQSLVCFTGQLQFPSLCELKLLRDVRIEIGISKELEAHRDTLWCDQIKDLFQKFCSIKEYSIIYMCNTFQDMIILDGFKKTTIPGIFDILDRFRKSMTPTPAWNQTESVVISSKSNSRQLNKLVKWICKGIICSKIYVVSTNNNLSQVLFDKLSRIKAEEEPYGRRDRLSYLSKDYATNNIPAALRSQLLDQFQITTITTTENGDNNCDCEYLWT